LQALTLHPYVQATVVPTLILPVVPSAKQTKSTNSTTKNSLSKEAVFVGCGADGNCTHVQI